MLWYSVYLKFFYYSNLGVIIYFEGHYAMLCISLHNFPFNKNICNGNYSIVPCPENNKFYYVI